MKVLLELVMKMEKSEVTMATGTLHNTLKSFSPNKIDFRPPPHKKGRVKDPINNWRMKNIIPCKAGSEQHGEVIMFMLFRSPKPQVLLWMFCSHDWAMSGGSKQVVLSEVRGALCSMSSCQMEMHLPGLAGR